MHSTWKTGGLISTLRHMPVIRAERTSKLNMRRMEAIYLGGTWHRGFREEMSGSMQVHRKNNGGQLLHSLED